MTSSRGCSVVPLDRYETFVAGDVCQGVWHRGRETERQAVYEALLRGHLGRSREPVGHGSVTKERLQRYRECGTALGVLKHKAKPQYRLRGNYCRDRFCPSCALQRRLRIRRVLGEAIRRRMATGTSEPPRLMTLTLKHSDSSVRDTCRRLKSCWRALLKQDWFTTAAPAGLWAMEVKYQPARAEWHVHLHAIIFARWVPVSRLKTAWLGITGDSYIVDVRTIRETNGRSSAEVAADYVAKYISKPATIQGMHPTAATDLIVGIKSQRLWSTWGGLKSLAAQVRAEDGDDYRSCDWLYVAPLVSVVLRAMRRDAQAASIIAYLGLDTASPVVPRVPALHAGNRRPLLADPGP